MEFGNEFKVDTFINPGTSTGPQEPNSARGKENSTIAQLENGGHIIMWESADQDGNKKAIIGRLYNADGTIKSAEFIVNTVTQFNEQHPEVVAMKDGGFLAVWETQSLIQGAGVSIALQRFNADGSRNGVETSIGNSDFELLKKGEDVDSAEVTALDDGGYAITWHSKAFTIGPTQFVEFDRIYTDETVRVQAFNADNSKRGEETSILLDKATQDSNPSIAQLENGGFVVAFVEVDTEIKGLNIVKGQRYNADGSKNGELFDVDRGTGNYNSAVIGLANGGFLVAHNHSTSSGNTRIIGQLYDADGSVQGGQFFISRSADNNSVDFELAKLNDGSIIAVWQVTTNGTFGGPIYGHMLDAAGKPFEGSTPEEGADFLISDAIGFENFAPAVAAFGEHGYLTTWHGGRQFLGGEVLIAKIFDENDTDGGVNNGIGSQDQTGTENDEVINQIFGNVTLKGEGGNDKLIALRGVNDIDGGTGSDFLLGGIKGDVLNGGDGNDVLIGDGSKVRGGADRLIGGKGDDALMGGQGADIFVFSPNDGSDFIASYLTNYVQNQGEEYYVRISNPDILNGFQYRSGDFEVGEDQVELHGFSDVNSGNVMDFVKDGDRGAVFSAVGTEITFYDVLTSQLSADDFLFV